jgi:hypothetical protein
VKPLMKRTWLGIAAVLSIACGCARTQPSPAGPSSQPASRPASSALKEISYVRMRVGVPNDVIRIAIDAEGAYQITRRGGGGANSSTRGKLSEEQKRRFGAAFAGWDQLETYYSPPGGVEEEFRFEISYGGKLIVASDAALDLPQTIRKVNRVCRDLVSAAGLL